MSSAKSHEKELVRMADELIRWLSDTRTGQTDGQEDQACQRHACMTESPRESIDKEVQVLLHDRVVLQTVTGVRSTMNTVMLGDVNAIMTMNTEK
jgi:hypothetical protein